MKKRNELTDILLKLDPSPRMIMWASAAFSGAITFFAIIVGIQFGASLGKYLVAGIIAMVLAINTALHPQFGIYILTFVLSINLSDIFTDLGLPGINKPLLALVVLSITTNALMSGSFKMKIKGVEWAMLGFAMANMASYFSAQDKDEAMSGFVDMVKDTAIVICMAYILRTEDYWKRSMWLVIIGPTIVNAMCAYQVFTGDFEQTFWGLSTVKNDQVMTDNWQARLNGPVYDPNFFGQVLIIFMPLVTYRIFDDPRLGVKIFGVVALLLNVLANLNTYSRGSFVTMMGILVFIAVERKIKPGLVVLIGMGVLVILPFMPEGYTERLETLSIFSSAKEDSNAVYQDSSFRGRTSELLAGRNMFLDYPITGVGASNYEVRYQEYASKIGMETRTEIRQAHCLYTETAAETGIFGLITFTLIIVLLFMGFSRARRIFKQYGVYERWNTWIWSLQWGVIGYLLAGIFLHADMIRYLWLLIGFGVAIIHIADTMDETERNATQHNMPVLQPS